MLGSISGCNSPGLITSGVFVLLLISRWTGEVLYPADGVLRHSSSARSGSSPESADRVRICFAIFTADSAFPLD